MQITDISFVLTAAERFGGNRYEYVWRVVMGIYLKGVSVPKDRDMNIIVHPDGAARVEVQEDWGTHLIGTDAYDIDEKYFAEIYKAMVKLP